MASRSLVVFGVAAWVLCRYGGMKPWHALDCIAFGFCLAASSIAATIRSLVTSIVSSSRCHG